MLNERSQSQKVTFYDSIYMKCSEQANLQRQKVDQRLPRVIGAVSIDGYRVSLEGDQNVRKLDFEQNQVYPYKWNIIQL